MAGVTKTVIRLFFFFFLPGLALAAPFVAIQNGESLTYKVSFGIFPHAGDIVIAGQSDTAAGHDDIAITVSTSTHGLVRGFYTYDNAAVALIDRPTGRLLSVKESG